MSFSKSVPISRLIGLIICNVPAKCIRLSCLVVLFVVVLTIFRFISNTMAQVRKATVRDRLKGWRVEICRSRRDVWQCSIGRGAKRVWPKRAVIARRCAKRCCNFTSSRRQYLI